MLMALVLLSGQARWGWSQESQQSSTTETATAEPTVGPMPDVNPNAQREADAAALADAALVDDAQADDDQTTVAAAGDQQLNVLELFFKGGVLMYPIAFMSFLVVAFSIERALALRRRRVAPPALIRDLRILQRGPGGFDPRTALRLCEQHPSALARVMRAAIGKLGRPSAEVQVAINDSCQREATRLYKNVRPITLAITITPLIGLLGTVQGMIQAFFVTSVSPVGVNKAQSLAEGIYTALVTTFAGLAVAIPAAVLAHYFEGKIQNLLGDIEDFVSEWLPYFDRYESRVRARGAEPASPPLPEPPRVAPESRLHKVAAAD